jgi:hypothetical protein
MLKIQYKRLLFFVTTYPKQALLNISQYINKIEWIEEGRIVEYTYNSSISGVEKADDYWLKVS